LLAGPGRRHAKHGDLGLAGEVTVGETGDQAAQSWFGRGEVVAGGEQEMGLLRPQRGVACFEDRDQGPGGGLERGRGQRVTEVGFVEPDDPQAGRAGVGAQPAERELVGRSQDDQGVRAVMPVADEAGVRDGEVECRVSRLTGLGTGREIGTGDQVEAGDQALTVRHVDQCTRSASAIDRPPHVTHSAWLNGFPGSS